MGRLGWTLAAALVSAIWGTTYLVTTELLPEDRPLLAAATRALPVGLVMVILLRRLPEGSWWWRVLVLGTLNIGLFFALLFVAAYRLPGGVAATIGSMQPLLVSVLAWPLLREPFGWQKVAAGLVGVVGVGLLVLRGTASFDAVGVAAGFGMAASMATGVVLTKRWGAPAPPLVFTAWQLVAGGLLLTPVALLVEGPPPALTVTNGIGFVYLGIVGTGLAYTLWFAGLRVLPASAASFLVLLSPLVAAAAGYLVVGETLTPLQLVGAAAVLAGVIMGQLSANTGARNDAEGRSPAPLATRDYLERSAS
jgi:probable blue pigment (indigoidine) exporter